MVNFKTKNPNLGKFWSVWQRKMLVTFTPIWSILLPFGENYGHLVFFVVILVCCAKKNLATLSETEQAF
jgi:hypothetical protein